MLYQDNRYEIRADINPYHKNYESMLFRCRRFSATFKRNILGYRSHTAGCRHNKTCEQAQKETPSKRMVFLFGMTRAEARTGHERSEKNVPVARFGARVRVAALSAASEPRRRLGCAALVVSSDWPSHLCPPVRTHPKNRLAFPAAGSASAVFPLRQPSGGHIRGRQTGRCLESGLLHLPQTEPPRKRWFFDFVTRRPAYPAAAPLPVRRIAWPAPAGWRCWGLPRRSPIC